MSALAWLFGLGALTIGFPVLFHLIRRTPKGQTEFSSLMFLKPSPPTLTRRSRLENILLLVLRGLAIALIAFAFMRPFFPGSSSLSDVEVANRRVAILVDTSASMKRSGLWDSAKQEVEKVLSNLEQGDDVSLLTFDRVIKQVVPFSDGSEEVGVDRAGLVRSAFDEIELTWSRSDLGGAMVAVADSLDVWRDQMKELEGAKIAKLQMEVISDMQKGSRIDAFQSYQWPASVFAKFHPLTPEQPYNATVQLLDRSEEDEEGVLRIRVANLGETTEDQFAVSWQDEKQSMAYDPIDFYVPAGTSRVIKVEPEDVVDARQFVVSGDTESFDNTFFTVPSKQLSMEVAYLGKDSPGDPERPQFYLKSALVETPTRFPQVRQVGDADAIVGAQTPVLVVVTSPVNDKHRKELNQFVSDGGTVVFVLSDPETTDSTSEWTCATAVDLEDDRRRDDYRMLADIEFSNPVFQPFSNPRFNDFTKIRFWKHQPVALEESEVSVIARFDNDAPAMWQRTIGNGNVFVLASGWQPEQSQLALSSKFVPFINGLVEIGASLPDLEESLLVNEPFGLPPNELGEDRVIVTPAGDQVMLSSDEEAFLDTNEPGIYRLVSKEKSASGSKNQRQTDTLFAVNVDCSESETEMIDVEQIEMFNVKVGEQQSASNELAMMREMKDREIENQQKVWKWLILAAILLLIAETWVAGRAGDKMLAEQGALQPG